MIRISIIIPVLNEEGMITDALTSLCHQLSSTTTPCEVIVVDGGSQDKTWNILSKLSAHDERLKVIKSPSAGRSFQMNTGADIASFDVLLFLHIDTLLPKIFNKEVQKALDNDFDWGRFDVCLSSPRWFYRIIGFMINWRSRLTGIATGDQCIFVNREVFKRIGGYQNLSLMEDVALSKTLKSHSKPYCSHVRVITSSRRWEKHGVIKTVLLMWWLRWLFFIGVHPDRFSKWYK